MNITERIEIDIRKFDELFEELEKLTRQSKDLSITNRYKKTIELAKQYRKDSEYFLNKKDYYTSFGCIIYAHGLLDSIRITENILMNRWEPKKV
ncbi:DUF357 domain-containing protein [Candidatus Micrarchaeota archaeon]|nr:DUF357 domain-containing protein [Candidatus Micrarchaeota archaeon]